MNDCVFKNGVCQNCGHKIPKRLGDNVRRSCGKAKPKLGDRIETILKTVGITQDRYKELKELAGWKPNCACPQRVYFLNRITKRAIIGYTKGGFSGAWEAAKELARETREHFATPK